MRTGSTCCEDREECELLLNKGGWVDFARALLLVSYLAFESVAKLFNSLCDLVKMDRLASSISLHYVHGHLARFV